MPASPMSIDELLRDDDFIRWVLLDTPEGRATWQEYLRLFPEQESVVSQARRELAIIAAGLQDMAREEGWEEIANEIGGQGLPPLRRIRGLFLKIGAAAAILICLSVGVYRFYAGSPVPAAADLAKDIPPGGNKAILTLGSGQRIVLDTAHDGQLTRQADALVFKPDSGSLDYRSDPTAKNQPPTFNTLTTPRGGQFHLTLADGTKVWLNAASSLRYPATFTGNTRVVEVTGEAYFEVAPDPARPFRVKNAGAEVTVLGTSFNINTYEDEATIRVTLVDGAVKVTHEKSSVRLKPGEQARVGDGLKIVRDPDLEAVLAWKNGRFQFEGAGVEEVMRQVARWYDVDIEYQGRPKEEHFRGGIPRSANVSEILTMLETTGAVKFRIEGRKIIVMP